MKYTKLFAIALVVIVLAACGAKEEKKEPKSNPDNSAVTTDDNINDYPEIVNPADSSSSETMIYDDPIEEQVDPPVEKPKVVEKPKKKKVKNTHQKRFYIVVGSFEKYDNAKKLNEYFKSKNYHPMILPKVNQYNRVALVSYVEEANARKAVKKLRVEHNDLTFWIYKW